MQPGEVFFALFSTGMVFGIPLAMIFTHHQRKMLELKLKLQGGSAGNAVQNEVAALREEVRALRDTTMQYDISFDSALQGIERRVGGLERQARIPADQSNQHETQNVTLGGRI